MVGVVGLRWPLRYVCLFRACLGSVFVRDRSLHNGQTLVVNSKSTMVLGGVVKNSAEIVCFLKYLRCSDKPECATIESGDLCLVALPSTDVVVEWACGSTCELGLAGAWDARCHVVFPAKSWCCPMYGASLLMLVCTGGLSSADWASTLFVRPITPRQCFETAGLAKRFDAGTLC